MMGVGGETVVDGVTTVVLPLVLPLRLVGLVVNPV